jgi:hypothetical protein
MRRINWNLHLSVINNDLDRILKYIHMLEGASTQENRALISMIEEEEQKLTPEEKMWWREEMHGSRLPEITEAIPQIMWHGAFMTLMSYMEHTLLDQARRHYRKVTHFAPELLPAGLTPDFRYVDGPIRYWKEWGFSFPNNGKLWNEIVMFRRMRNWIAHEGGELDDSTETAEIVNYINRRKSKSLSVGPVGFFSNTTLTMSPEFCREAVETVRRFFTSFVPNLP